VVEVQHGTLRSGFDAHVEPEVEARAECVRAPTETTSTPVAAIAATVSRFTPPDASTIVRPAMRRRRAEVFEREVVEHDRADPARPGAGSEHRVELVEAVDLDLEVRRVGQRRAGRLQRGGDRPVPGDENAR
jgi:hypothetical protein